MDYKLTTMKYVNTVLYLIDTVWTKVQKTFLMSRSPIFNGNHEKIVSGNVLIANNLINMTSALSTKKFFIAKFLLLLLLGLDSCNDAGGKVDEKSTAIDTTNRVVAQDTVPKQAESFITAPRKTLAPRLGDFDSMLRRRTIRVLVPYSRTLFFNDKGRERGLTADQVREFERYLNKKYQKQLRNVPFSVAIVPTSRENLITDVVQGIGDMAAGNLTVSESRSQQVDFISPKDLRSVSEIILTHKKDGPVNNVEQMSGRTILVRKSSSYFESLQKLNETLSGKGMAPAKIDTVSEDLEDEDLMEMLDAGIIPAIVVDDWKAKMWAQILPNIVVNENAAVRSGGQIGWAYRKNSPLLAAVLEDFYYKFAKPLGTFSYVFKKYTQQAKRLQDPTKDKSWKRYQEIMKLFENYGNKYDFDPLMLAALGFQESRLDQNARSHVGAVGVMQLMPATGKEMKVGDVTVMENNIHAGSKYLNTIMTKYFKDAQFNEFNRSLFAFASYNAGPSRIAGLRKVAAERGLNPDWWLHSVEIVASEKIGKETTTYVRNIVKYFYSYKLMQELAEERRKEREGASN